MNCGKLKCRWRHGGFCCPILAHVQRLGGRGKVIAHSLGHPLALELLQELERKRPAGGQLLHMAQRSTGFGFIHHAIAAVIRANGLANRSIDESTEQSTTVESSVRWTSLKGVVVFDAVVSTDTGRRRCAGS